MLLKEFSAKNIYLVEGLDEECGVGCGYYLFQNTILCFHKFISAVIKIMICSNSEGRKIWDAKGMNVVSAFLKTFLEEYQFHLFSQNSHQFQFINKKK